MIVVTKRRIKTTLATKYLKKKIPDNKVDIEAWHSTGQLWETRNSLEISKSIGNKKNTRKITRNSLEMSKYKIGNTVDTDPNFKILK